MKKYRAYCNLMFQGTIDIEAENRDDVYWYIKHNFWATLDNVNNGDCENIKHWSFDHGISDVSFDMIERIDGMGERK